MRTPMITRTMNTMTVTVLVADKEKAELFNQTIELGRAISDPKKLEKVVRKAVEDTPEMNIKLVDIVDTKVNEAIYGMSEDEFLKHAHLLDENRKIVPVSVED